MTPGRALRRAARLRYNAEMFSTGRFQGRRIGLGAAYGLGRGGVLQAFDRGVRFFLWGAIPKADFGRALRELARGHRDEIEIAVQSYSRSGRTIGASVELALWRLGIEQVDWLCLGNWERLPGDEVRRAVERLQERGLVRQVMISCHHRPAFREFLSWPSLAGWMVRYNAAHRRAEEEVFPVALSAGAPGEAAGGAGAGALRPAIVVYTALRWGTLLDPRYAPEGEGPLSAVEAYRFVLSSPYVDLCLAGPRDEAELAAALRAMELGPLDEEGLRRARRVGDAAYAHGRAQPPPRLRNVIREAPALVRSLLRDGLTEHLLSRFNR